MNLPEDYTGPIPLPDWLVARMTISDPRVAARALIEAYVRRGDSYESLKAGAMGSYDRAIWVFIGSGGPPHCHGRGADDICVTRIQGATCCYRFSLRKLYDEIRRETHGEPVQARLLGNF